MARFDSGVMYDGAACYDEPEPASIMKKVKVPLSTMVLDEKVQLLQNVVTGLTGNAAFSTPSPSVGDLTALRTSVVNKINEIEAANDQLAVLYAERDALELLVDNALLQEAGYVQGASGGDEVKILSTGFTVRGGRAPVGPLPAPSDLHSNYGAEEGSVECQWDRVRGAQAYFVECSSTANGPWNQVYTGTSTHCTLTGLIPGSQYWFRVRALGAAGLGPWSDPTTKRAA